VPRRLAQHHGGAALLGGRQRQFRRELRAISVGRLMIGRPLVGLADQIAHTSLQHRIAVVPELAGAHGGVELEDRRAEVLRRRPEL
jgi:hypothetical protein